MSLIFVLILLVFVVALLACIGVGLCRGQSLYTGGGPPHVAKGVPTRTKSEAFAIQMLEELTGAKFPTAHPEWLRWRGRVLELDGYNAAAAIALEFSGPLHTKWTPSFESYAKYISRVIKDQVKIKTCAKKGITLIVVDQTMPRHHVRAYIESRLADAGRLPRPANYIPAQVVEPYRNPQLEESLGVDGEFKALQKIK